MQRQNRQGKKDAGDRKASSIFDRLAEPKHAVKKHELALKTGCAELKGMLVTDRALQEQLKHLENLRVNPKAQRIAEDEEDRARSEKQKYIEEERQRKLREKGAQMSAVASATANLKIISQPCPEKYETRNELESFQKKIDEHPGRYQADDIYVNPLSIYE